MFLTEKLYYVSVKKNYKLDKNIRHFTCDLVLLLGQTPFGRNIANMCSRPHYQKRRAFTAYGQNAATVASVFLCTPFVPAVVKRLSCRPHSHD